MKNLLSVFALFVVSATLANAHAFLDSSEPPVGSTIHCSPGEIKIWFTKQLAKDGSSITVFDSHGAEVDLKDDKIDPDNKFLITVSVPQLPAGKYKVIWNAICFDTHHTTGTFQFTICP